MLHVSRPVSYPRQATVTILPPRDGLQRPANRASRQPRGGANQTSKHAAIKTRTSPTTTLDPKRNVPVSHRFLPRNIVLRSTTSNQLDSPSPYLKPRLPHPWHFHGWVAENFPRHVHPSQRNRRVPVISFRCRQTFTATTVRDTPTLLRQVAISVVPFSARPALAISSSK